MRDFLPRNLAETCSRDQSRRFGAQTCVTRVRAPMMREREYGLILLLQEGRESKHAGGERHWRHTPARADRRLHQPPSRDSPGAPHAHEATRTSRMHSTAEQDTSERPALVRPHAHTRSTAISVCSGCKAQPAEYPTAASGCMFSHAHTRSTAYVTDALHSLLNSSTRETPARPLKHHACMHRFPAPHERQHSLFDSGRR